jgi:hypothetical protein
MTETVDQAQAQPPRALAGIIEDAWRATGGHCCADGPGWACSFSGTGPDGLHLTRFARAGRWRPSATARGGTRRLAARLLAEIGDCRSRFPDPEPLAGLAGVAPVTRKSGKHTSIGFRWAVNRQLRDAVCDFAADSRHASPWAAAIYDNPRPWQRPPARRPHHRPRLDLRHLALLARRHRLRLRQAQRPAAHPGPAARHTGRWSRPAGPVTAAIIAALRAHAVGLHPDEAGAELLIRHGGILPRDDFARYVHTGTSISDGTTLMAWIDWDAALSALHDGQIPVCGGEQRILQLAASIAEGFPSPCATPSPAWTTGT